MIIVTTFFFGKDLQHVLLLFHVSQRIFQPYIAGLGIMLHGLIVSYKNWLQSRFALHLSDGDFIMK